MHTFCHTIPVLQIQSNGLAALQRLDAHLTSIETAVAALDATQKKGSQTSDASIHRALHEHRTSFQVVAPPCMTRLCTYTPLLSCTPSWYLSAPCLPQLLSCQSCCQIQCGLRFSHCIWLYNIRARACSGGDDLFSAECPLGGPPPPPPSVCLCSCMFTVAVKSQSSSACWSVLLRLQCKR